VARRLRPKKIHRNLSTSQRAALRRKWRSWSRVLTREVGDLLWQRQIFLDLNEVGRHNDRIGEPSAFIDWIRLNYVVSTSVEIRRLTDLDPRSISIGRLLWELIAYPSVITRSAHRSLYSPGQVEIADISFDNLAGAGRDSLSSRSVRSDLRRLEDAEERVRRLVNKRFAHRAGPGAVRKQPTYQQLHGVLDVLDGVAVKYHILLTAEGLTTAYATPVNDHSKT